MNTYSTKITSLQANKIKEIIEKYNASFDVIQYSNWRAKTTSFQATYYTSGKLLVQGKDISKIAAEIDSVIGIKRVEEATIEIEYEKYIGTDESGKGDFFGPLVIAGVQTSKENKQRFIELGIKDSKKLDDKKIKQLAAIIKANAVHSVVVITPQKYNELYAKFNNLNKLLAWGHARAIENILEKSPCDYALADKFGDESLIRNALMQKGQKITLKQMVRAEADIAVAAASILARAEFVKRMDEMAAKYELNFSKGASDKVISQAKIFSEKYSKDRLNEVAKLHFKTAQSII
ncbi:ribonuclease HIII [bacterium]|nr:ribonuclease HIII [bacterium]